LQCKGRRREAIMKKIKKNLDDCMGITLAKGNLKCKPFNSLNI
jgi:hypothetical protein